MNFIKKSLGRAKNCRLDQENAWRSIDRYAKAIISAVNQMKEEGEGHCNIGSGATLLNQG